MANWASTSYRIEGKQEDLKTLRKKAEIIIQEVQAAVSQWESLATLLQIPAREMAMFKKRFKLNL